jgi:homing endonuclease-like protein
MHYARWRKHGNTETVLPGGRKPSPGPKAECSIKECGGAVYGYGWCNKHWKRWRKYGDPLFVKHEVSQAGPLATFLANIDERGPDECWPWKRPPCKTGYGQVKWLDGKLWYAHRVAYLLAYGKIPVSDDPTDPIEIDHVCHDHEVCHETDRCPHRLCCNPAHLVAKPRSENTGRTMFWQPCPPGCACGRHYGHGGGGGSRCAPGCTCGRHHRRACAP